MQLNNWHVAWWAQCLHSHPTFSTQQSLLLLLVRIWWCSSAWWWRGWYPTFPRPLWSSSSARRSCWSTSFCRKRRRSSSWSAVSSPRTPPSRRPTLPRHHACPVATALCLLALRARRLATEETGRGRGAGQPASASLPETALSNLAMRIRDTQRCDLFSGWALGIGSPVWPAKSLRFVSCVGVCDALVQCSNERKILFKHI